MTLIISICRVASLHTLSCLKVGGIKINVEKKVDIEFDNEMVVRRSWYWGVTIPVRVASFIFFHTPLTFHMSLTTTSIENSQTEHQSSDVTQNV